MNRDADAGKMLLRLDMLSNCSPAIKAVMPPETNAQAVADAINADWRASLEAEKETPEEVAEREQHRLAREAAIDNHPANGTLGYWHVEGFRHECIVRASSCREAREKAIAWGGIGDLGADAEFIGVEMPDVLPL